MSEANVRWTGDHLARLIWKCLDCGATALEDQHSGDFHRNNCRVASYMAIPLTDPNAAAGRETPDCAHFLNRHCDCQSECGE